MVADIQRLENAARMSMGGFDDASAPTLQDAAAAPSRWFARVGYAVIVASLCAVLLVALV